MKNALTVVTFPLFAIGLFANGTKTSNVELESVTEGDSVTLKSGVTERKKDEGIEWRFNEIRIAKISIGSSEIWVKADGSFKDGLQLDSQTGDLKISNIKTTDSGRYKPKVSSPRGSPPEMIFTVKVVSADAAKPVTVNVGDSVTLLTNLTEIQRYEVIQWRFGQQKTLVAEINGKTGIFNTYDGPDERFRDGLKLDNQTGSLIITNTTTTDSEVYEADISSSRYTIHKSFSVTVSADVKPVSVMEGDNVTLHTGLTEIQRDDQILWKFGDQDKPVASLIKGSVNKTWNDTDLNDQTGDLTIINIQGDKYVDYKVEINTRRMILHRNYQITMTDAVKLPSVKEGESVILPIVTEIQKDDLIHWMFGGAVIAEIRKADQRFFTSDGPDGRFRGRLNHQTGSLIIMNTRITDSGDYHLKISSSRSTINRRITVTVTGVFSRGKDGVKTVLSVSGSGLSPVAIAGIVVGVLLVAAAVGAVAGVIYSHCCKKQKKRNKIIFEQNKNSKLLAALKRTEEAEQSL